MNNKQCSVTVNFADSDDASSFMRYKERADTQSGTVGGLYSGLLCAAIKRASVQIPKNALSQLEFDDSDFAIAERMAGHLRYEQTVYTSTSALIGLFCLPENPAHPENRHKPHVGGCIIKTKELGFLFVQAAEDCGVEL